MSNPNHPTPVKKSASHKRLRGRPRSDSTRRAILAATLRLLRTVTIQSVTIEAIAKAAGVSKATIYRWWSSKAAVVIDAFMEHHVVSTPMDSELPAVEALTAHLVLLVKEYGDSRSGRLVAQIIAEGQNDPAVLKAFRERFADDRSELVLRVIEAGQKRGELRKDVPAKVMAECLYAPVYFRLLLGSPPLSRSFAEGHAKTMLGLFKSSARKP
ncbi:MULTISPECIES: TetR/AcrR family transcriptional regulator [unclassified Bradyrhizobium]|uniref:TetR/AcrR family transcriptional regulator n=1 Tax=unclassified Bradyrhizobium TaxID=2631580 RepID=UPI0021111CD3|nr:MULTISPECIES: TetR/AcrR family transcriptional regulator [unclassified Bradyrhizobium]MCK1277432.1 TetR/AcrR family transcriptional regulator [Bradyrhizobium sp. 61]MCK1447404.1 TetR/AcrR family transcriptional regulator [Bradyrhizobium sp. 48]MCK1465629.1 TetR/AcrR family transcriptional regulator [Bradyrhizobium sp. 2]